jgi:cytidine deaminase
MGFPLTPGDAELVAAAQRIIHLRWRRDWHTIGAALRTTSGRVFAAVNVDANVGRLAVCAEAIAIGMGAAEGDTEIDTIVAVDRDGTVVSPCGMCRELISDYSPEARVLVPSTSGPAVTAIRDLLPNKYSRS